MPSWTRLCLLKEPLLNLQPLVDLERGVAILRRNQKCGSLLKRGRSVVFFHHCKQWSVPSLP